MKIGGTPPEGPYLGHIPPTGQIPRRGPAAYPPGQVTAQAPSQDAFPQNAGQSPYGDGGLTTQPAPKGPTYPVVLGKPAWLPATGGEVRAYRFGDGHVYEFETSHADAVLLTDKPPDVQRVRGYQVQVRGAYRDINGAVGLWPGGRVQ